MDTGNTMRVNAYAGSYGGHSSSPQDRQHQRRQKISALLDAVAHGNLDAAQLAFKVLANFDRALTAEPLFVRLSKFLEAGNLFLAQQVMRDIKAKLINATRMGAQPSHADVPARGPQPDGLHFIDTRA